MSRFAPSVTAAILAILVSTWSAPQALAQRGGTAPPPTPVAEEPCADIAEALRSGDVRTVTRAAPRSSDRACAALFAVFDGVKAGDGPAIRQAAERADGMLPLSAEVVEAFALLSEGRRDEAIASLETPVMPWDTESTAVDNPVLPLMLEAAGRTEEALAAYEAREVTARMAEAFEGGDFFIAGLASAEVQRHATLAHRAGERDQAGVLYAAILALFPYDVEAREGSARLAAGQPPARPALDRNTAFAEMLDQFSSVVLLSNALTRMSSGQVAADPFEPVPVALAYGAVLLAPTDEALRLRLGNLLYSEDAYAGALRVSRTVGARSPLTPDARILEALSHEALGRYPAARRALATAARSSRIDIKLSAAEIYADIGATEEAIRLHDAAVTLADFPRAREDALHSRGNSRFVLGDLRGAAADGRALLALTPQRLDTRLAATFLMAQDPASAPEAIAAMRTELGRAPDNALVLNSLGFTLLEGAPDLHAEGFRLIARAVELQPANPAIVDSWGWAHYLFGDFERAVEYLSRAATLTEDDPNPEILEHLGDAYWRLGDLEDARRTWQAALEADPDATRRRALEARLREGLTTPPPEARRKPVVSVGPRTPT
jgi:tetratricopeptide (TPR) repeat protein